MNGRSKRLGELTSSIVPRGTSFHRRVELEFPPIGCDPAGFSRCYGLFPGPSELGAVNPNAVQDHGQAACRDLSAAEIISCSRRGKWKTSLLRASFDSPPKARRPIVYLTNFPGYVASLWLSEEIPDETEIDLLPRSWD